MNRLTDSEADLYKDSLKSPTDRQPTIIKKKKKKQKTKTTKLTGGCHDAIITLDKIIFYLQNITLHLSVVT